MKIVHSKHDRFVKAMMADPAVATDFFTMQLPSAVLDKVDLSTLHLEETTFIDKGLDKRESDVIFSVKQCNGQDAYLYLLLEHQSESDPLMPFRVLYYLMQLLNRHVLQNKNKPLPLPFVFPIIVFNGVRPWSHSLDIFTLFGEFEDMARAVFFEPVHLLDTNMLDEQDFRKKHIANLMLLSLYRSMGIDLKEKIDILVSLCHEFLVDPDSHLGRIVLEYNTDELDAEKGKSSLYFDKYVKQFPPDFQEVIMNLRQATLDEGIEQGIEQGIRQGHQKGVEEVALELLRAHADETLILKATHIDKDRLAQLKEQLAKSTRH